MGDPPKPADNQSKGWVVPFAIRMCLIAWSAAIMTEILPRSSVEFVCLVFGSHAAAIGVLTCLFVWLRFQHGLCFLLMVVTSLPAAYFGVVLRQLARERGWPV